MEVNKISVWDNNNGYWTMTINDDVDISTGSLFDLIDALTDFVNEFNEKWGKFMASDKKYFLFNDVEYYCQDYQKAMLAFLKYYLIDEAAIY